MGEVGTIWIKIGAKIDEFNKGVTDVEKSLKKVGDKLSDIGKKMSITGGVITGAFSIALAKSSEFAHELDLISQKTGISASELSKWSYAAKLAGTDIGGVTIGLRFLSKSMLEVSLKGEKAASGLNALGIKVNDASGKMRPMNDVLLEVADKFKALPDGATKSALAIDIFGRSGTEMIPILNQGASGIASLMKKADELRVSLSGEQIKAMAGFKEATESLQEALKGTSNQITAAMAPALTGLIERIRDLVGGINRWIESHPGLTSAIGQTVLALGGLLTGTGTFLYIGGKFMTMLAGLTAALHTTTAALAMTTAGLTAVAGALLLAGKLTNDYINSKKDLADADMREMVNLTQLQKKFTDTARAAGLNSKEIHALTEKYNGNIAALVMAISKGKEGVKLQTALAEISKKSAAEYGKFKTALDAANPSLDAVNKFLADAAKKTKTLNEEFDILTRAEIETKISRIKEAFATLKLPIEDQRKLNEELAILLGRLTDINPLIMDQNAAIRKAQQTIDDATQAYNAGAISLAYYSKVVSEAQAAIEQFSDKAMLKGLPEAIQRTGNALQELKYAPRDAVPYIIAFAKYYNISIDEAKKKIAEIAPEWSRSVDQTAGHLSSMREMVVTSWTQMTDQIRGIWQAGLLEMFQGTKTFGDLIQNTFSAIGSAVSEGIFKAFTKVGSKLAESLGFFAGPIGAAVGAIAGSLISMIGGLFKKAQGVTRETLKEITDMVGRTKAEIYIHMNEEQVKKEIERLKKNLEDMAKEMSKILGVYGEVSESTLKKIAEARQKGMEGYAAISKYFADIIRDTGVTGENINKLWQGAGEIIDHIRQGALSAADGIKSLGDSFAAMVEGARKLGQEGSKAMVDFILKIRASGLDVPEVTKYVLDQLGKIPAALATIINNMYMPSTPIKDLQKELDKLTEKLRGVKEGTDEWKTITTRIKEIQDELGVANKAIPKTTKELDAMGRIAVASFQAMLANGKTFIEALDAMKVPLQGLLDRYKALGIKIPEYLKPLLHMQALSVKFRVEFENMSAALDILNSLRNSAYLTQDTFNSLVTVVNSFARALLGIKGSINAFMNTAKLSQTQIQALLPIVAQFAGAAAIFGLSVPAWMKTFVTKQLGVDWKKFQAIAAEQASAGIATVEKLKTMLDHLSIYDSRMKDRFYALRTGIRDKLDFVIGAIKGLPHAQSGGVFTKPSLVHVAERGPEVIIPLNQLAGIGPQQVIVEIQPIVIPRGDKYIIEFLQKSIEHGNIRIPITAVG